MAMTMRRSIRQVGDLMTGDLVFLGPDDTVASARELLTQSRLHAIPVLDQDRAIGLVTLADFEGRAGGDTLASVTPGPPITVDVGTPVGEAAELMRSRYVHHLMVTEGSGRHEVVVGILSSYDLLAVLID